MLEIERKFIVDKKKWNPKGAGKSISQGYLSVDSERTVRVRISGDEAFLTIKGKSSGISRTELEYKVPVEEAKVLMTMCLDFIVEKTRYTDKIGSLIWEIDVFKGENEGLVLAEVELESENQHVDLPDWIEKEVSDDYRFFNSWLSQNPFSGW